MSVPERAGRRRSLKRLARWAGVAAAGPFALGCSPADRPATDAAPVDASAFGPGRIEGGWIGPDLARGHALVGGKTDSTWDSAGAPLRRTGVLIVGAGIAGLACARALRRSGVDDFHLLELEDAAGGNSRSHRMGLIDCPIGAHYLPLPGPQAAEVSEWLHEIGLLRTEQGRVLPDERHLCHSPQERLFIDGHWREGLLPPPDAFGHSGDGAGLLRQYQAFAQAVRRLGPVGFALPSFRAGWTDAHRALDAQTFADWLDAQGLHHPALRWYLDYCCRDDYGAPASTVSAWAGLHYFASRHGFSPPGVDGRSDTEREAVFTWPEGNAWLVRRLAEGLGARLLTGRVALAVQAQGREGVQVDVWNAASQAPERWQARQVVLAVPLRVAQRLLRAPSGEPAMAALAQAAERLPSSPWLVAQWQLDRPLADRIGAAPAWDNVVYGSAALGYVDALHQSLAQRPGAPVLSGYHALGGASARASPAAPWPQAAAGVSAGAALRDGDWRAWAAWAAQPLLTAHPDLMQRLTRVALARHGHAMALPAPGVRGSAALRALREGALADGRVHLAHADLAGYSVFEEAFTLGHLVGERLARGWGRRRAR